MANKTTLTWQGDMAFDAELDGHHFMLDLPEAMGGNNSGPRPKGLLLTALAGCTGMDVVSILKKMKVEDYALAIHVDAKITEQHPKVLEDIVITYQFQGSDLPAEKIKHAVELSDTRYCGVAAMLKKATTITSEIYLNGELI
jgi:putative redox protein